jgi:hypothetical protein
MGSNNSIVAEALAKAIHQVAQQAHNEEELRVGVERALSDTLHALGLTTMPEYEKTTLSGAADAVYGHVVIEYKRPGRIAGKGYADELSEQIARYLTDLAQRAGSRTKPSEALEKMIGVGLDGQQILFLRYSATGRERESPLAALPGTQTSFLKIDKAERAEKYEGGFQIVGPVPIGRESIELLLLYLRSLSRKPLTPQALAADFGPQGEIAPNLVNLFYTALQTHREHPRVAALFSEWDHIFGIVYGEELGQAQEDAPELAALYRAVPDAKLKPLFFSIHTYYALLMKFLAVELASLQGGALIGSFITALPTMSGKRLHRELTNLENGGTFALLGINNFLEGDFFGWYLDVWNTTLADGIRTLAQTLADFEPATSTLEPEYTRDLLKKLYHYLVPRKLRHDLGEYYTPDWLAERLLSQVGYKGDPDKRLIDPGCGSGTFLTLALRHLRQYAADHLIAPSNVLEAALDNIVGFDLNPLSVIAARTNYLLALGDLLRYRRGPVDLPVYMCDSILTPTERADLFGTDYRLSTVVGNFDIPGETVDAGEVGILSSLLEECVRDQYTPQEFLDRARQELTVREAKTATVLESLYRQLYRLDEEGRNGLWARLLKNAFAPVFVGEFDFVVGNPPWVNWESLSPEYRKATKQLWANYGLFSLSGHAARLGGGKKDLAMLFTYAAADHYLKPDGKLGFIITQTVFKTKGAGAGFRRFQLGAEGKYLYPFVIDDMSEIKPFPGVANQTAVMILRKGQAVTYPVSYTFWQGEKWGRGRRRTIPEDLTLAEVEEMTLRSNLWAEPVDSDDPTSPWITARKAALQALHKVLGPADYQARAGSCTWANGIYWIKILHRRPDGLLIIDNREDIGRRDIESERAAVEPDLVYPLLRGREVNRWQANPTMHILVTQDPETRKGYTERKMQIDFPNLYGYLKRFEDTLRQRSGMQRYFDPEEDPFYSIYNVAPYTFAPYKVVWREVAPDINAAVISTHESAHLEEKVIVPDHTLVLISYESADEAHFACAVLNSAPSRLVVKAYVTMHPSPHVLEYISVPQFDAENPLHTRLMSLSQQAHQFAEVDDEASLAKVQNKIDAAAAELWGITDKELQAIRQSLAELV